MQNGVVGIQAVKEGIEMAEKKKNKDRYVVLFDETGADYEPHGVYNDVGSQHYYSSLQDAHLEVQHHADFKEDDLSIYFILKNGELFETCEPKYPKKCMICKFVKASKPKKRKYDWDYLTHNVSFDGLTKDELLFLKRSNRTGSRILDMVTKRLKKMGVKV